MSRSLNTAGPGRPEDDYMLPASMRLPTVRALIDEKKYFVVHAAHHPGKTTAPLVLAS